jgi:virginiamycin A acetyltransferase
MTFPDKNTLFPLPHHNKLCFLKNLVSNPNIIVGDYTYYDDFEDVRNFESNVKYHFDFIGDKLIIGKFCMIASGATFIMNGGNHLSGAISAYPFAIFENGWEKAMEGKEYPVKGDTIIGNDVWIGHNATLMPGITIGDGAIIATNATVTRDVEPYTIVGGNPATVIRKRFSDETIIKLLEMKWWDWPIEKITDNVQTLIGSNLPLLTK